MNTFVRAEMIIHILRLIQWYCLIKYFSSLPPLFIFIMWRCKKFEDPWKSLLLYFPFEIVDYTFVFVLFYGVVCMLLNENRCIRPEQKKFYSSLSLLQKHTSVNEFQILSKYLNKNQLFGHQRVELIFVYLFSYKMECKFCCNGN